jgi:hypothetical protein
VILNFTGERVKSFAGSGGRESKGIMEEGRAEWSVERRRRRKSRLFMKSQKQEGFFLNAHADSSMSLDGESMEQAAERVEGKRKMDGMLGYMSRAVFIGGPHAQVLCIL